MRMCQLPKYFCCCFKLRTGVILLGWLNVIIYTISVIFAGIGCFSIDYIFTKLHRPNSINPWEWRECIKTFIGIILVVALVDLVASFLMILGAKKNNRYLLIPWLITGAITMTTQTFLYTVPGFFDSGEFALIGTYLGIFINLLFQLYLWLCVISLFKGTRITTHQNEEVQPLIADSHINYDAILT